MIEEFPQLVANLGVPVAIVIYLLYERHTTMAALEQAIKGDLVHAIYELREEIVKLNERVNVEKEK
jgi:hypothetical protein